MTVEAKIISLLSKNCNSQLPYQVFRDWVDVVEASLDAIPNHLQSLSNGQQYDDKPEVKELFEKVQAKYRKDEWSNFCEAFAVLLSSAEDSFEDVIGNVYMNFGISNKHTGQFFTPFSICDMMARMSMSDIEAQIHSRIQDGIKKSVEATALLFAGCCIQEPDKARDWFFSRVLPAALPFVEPITVCDPCCGSGAMLLAAAKNSPRWALDFGVVQFYGMDIDRNCVQMARINMMLHGLNGYNMRCSLSLSDAEIASLPEPLPQAIADAKDAEEREDIDRIEEISLEVRYGVYSQTSLFDSIELTM